MLSFKIMESFFFKRDITKRPQSNASFTSSSHASFSFFGAILLWRFNEKNYHFLKNQNYETKNYHDYLIYEKF